MNSDAQALEEQAQDAQRPEHGGDFLERQQRVMQVGGYAAARTWAGSRAGK